MQVDGLKVDQRVIEGQDDEAAPDDLAARLVPQRELGADDWILVDPGLDLGGPEDGRIGREPIDQRLPVARAVHPSGDPRDHVRPAGRDHRLEEEELDALLARQAHDDVVRLGRQRLLARLALRHGPQVVLPEELLGVRHVVSAEDAGLDVEQFLRHADVLPKIVGHRAEGLEQVREDALIGPDDRVVRVRHVEMHRPVVGIHRDLHAVPDVVERLIAKSGRVERGKIEWLGVREPLRRRERILDVDEAAGFVDDKVGILVEAQERCDPAEPVPERAVEQQLAIAGDLVADQQVQVAEPQREEQPHHGVVEADAGRPCPAGLGADGTADIALAGRKVELVLLGADDDVRAVSLPEVDPRLRDRRGAARRYRRQVADDEPRLPFATDLVDRHHRDADPVGVDDPLVDPAGGGRVLVQGKLAGGQHDLALDAVDAVAVRVDIGEVVVATNRLELVEAGPERSVVPQAGARERVRLTVDLVRGEDGVPAERLVLPVTEVVRQPRHRDVVADIALFLGVLVRFDGEALDRLRVEPADHQRGEKPHGDGQGEGPQHPGEGGADQQDGGDPGHHRQHVVGEELGVLVGEADARGHAPGAVREVELVELVAEGHRQQEQPTEYRQVDPDGGREDESAARRPHQVAAERDDQGGHDDAIEQPLNQAQERQLEQEEAHVPAEDGIGDHACRRRREWHAVDPQEDRLPGRRDRGADEDREEEGEGPEGDAGERGQVRQVSRLKGDLTWGAVAVAGTTELTGPVARRLGRLCRFAEPIDERSKWLASFDGRRRQVAGQEQIRQQENGGHEERAEEEADRRAEASEEDGVETDADIPQGVGPQVQPDAEQEEQREDRKDRGAEPDLPADPGGAAAGVRSIVRATWRSAARRTGATRRDRRGPAGCIAAVLAGVDVLAVIRVRSDCLASIGGGGGVLFLVVVVRILVWSGVATPRLHRARILATGGGLAAAHLVHEVVEQFAHPG